MSDLWLYDRRRDVFSQTGEDGVIEAILDRLPQRDGWCVEFGAWDGRFLSNVANLIDNRAYKAVMIEGDPVKHAELCRNYAGNDGVHCVNAFVGFGEDDGLDPLLARTPIPRDYDFLSIDIDGNDHAVWEAAKFYRPKAVCIEFNPTIPIGVEYVQPRDFSVRHSNSCAALIKLGKAKGYELVSVLAFNAFFVRREFFPAFEIADNSEHRLRTDTSLLTHIFTGMDGTVLLAGSCKLPWHDTVLDAVLDPARMQVVPRVLRTFPPDYTAGQKRLARLQRLLTRLGRRLSW